MKLNLGSIQIPINAATKTFAYYRIYDIMDIWKRNNVEYVKRLNRLANSIKVVQQVVQGFLGLVRFALEKYLKGIVKRDFQKTQIGLGK